ncbi:HIT domain-containing protein [Candidatus Bandiella numerosa]|jgi:histidine triad (HIT) family protein|uniref:HIT domain-containing protein n=1 Tax=Candidatus Bandiella numerosa TaxID=2570586 RepID=UPI00249E8B2C|nr:HIT domain-containing protein [Candidatus Bandiella numerosa]MBY0580191.1 HIT domain-containing protein [Rickettsiales bacterium]WHA05153.1 HIT domain-containing protein [Candidatus Bandiella numerosa]
MYNKANIFAKIIKKEVPCKMVHEDEHTLIFHDINPSAPIHLLAIPKGEFSSFEDFVQKASTDQFLSFFASIQMITDKLKINKSGYRLITNHGKDAMQTVEHFHIHIIAGKALGPLITADKHHAIK